METFVNKPKKAAKGVLPHMFFTSDEFKEIVNDAGDAGYALLSFYVGLSSMRNANMEDEQLAKMMGKSLSSIKKSRLALTKAGWFSRVRTTIKGESKILYTVGKNDNSQFTACLMSKTKGTK